ncbi:YncE family protein [Pelagicoccus mobilis]|uniref:Uncharacterized protein n=1 Tax=Pelagicoccus mobilis TaxID=415221 RepID=A0A934S1B4_9BACT|nr:hypothetical protein [Pelagicoccus mobilis]MBK1879194.1 hypothetical protein [Pelagicoccus mobilis]
MKTITELSRHKAPADLPQALAFDGSDLWIGSLDTKRIYQIDTSDWSVKSEVEVNGLPWGLVATGDSFRLIRGETEEDSRYVRSFSSGDAAVSDSGYMCPDDTGSQLSYDAKNLHVSQWYNQKVLALDSDGEVERAYDAPRGICGQTIVDSYIYLINTADEETNEYYIGRIDRCTGEYEELAEVPFQARALAFDGEAFLTNHRAAGETVRFKIA